MKTSTCYPFLVLPLSWYNVRKVPQNLLNVRIRHRSPVILLPEQPNKLVWNSCAICHGNIWWKCAVAMVTEFFPILFLIHFWINCITPDSHAHNPIGSTDDLIGREIDKPKWFTFLNLPVLAYFCQNEREGNLFTPLLLWTPGIFHLSTSSFMWLYTIYLTHFIFLRLAIPWRWYFDNASFFRILHQCLHDRELILPPNVG